MANEQQTQQSDQSSSQQGAGSTSAASTEASGAASQSTKADTTAAAKTDTTAGAAKTDTTAAASSTAAASARPEGLPETYWDAEKNTLKVEPAALIADLKERDELKAFKATEDSKRLTLPKDVNGYEAKLPDDFKAPEGIKFEFDQADPLLAQAKEMALKKGWSQTDFSDALALHAAGKVAEASQMATAKAAEITKLGVNGPARVDAVTAWLKAVGGADADTLVKVLDYAPVAGTVQAFERMMQKFSSQGGAAFSQSHRTQPDTKPTAEEKDSWSYVEQRHYDTTGERPKRQAA